MIYDIDKHGLSGQRKLFGSLFFVQKRNCPEGQPLWKIVLNFEQVGRNPAAVFELYPVEAVSSAIDSCRCRSRKELAERFGYSSRNVARYLRINDLIRPIRDLVDGSRISLVAAVELSYLDAGEQWLVYRGILSRGTEADTQSSGRIVIIKGMIPTGKQVDTGTGQSGWLLHRRNHKHSIRYIELILLLKNPLIKIYVRTRL